MLLIVNGIQYFKMVNARWRMVPDPPLITRTRLQRRSASLAWRLDREMKRRLILNETGFSILAKGFLLPTNRRRDLLFVSELS